MPTAKKVPAKSRMSIYLTAANRARLDRIPRGRKTELVNQALAEVLSSLERLEKFDSFLETVAALKPIAAPAASETMIRQLRDGGAILPKT